ncbi:methylated-DNA--[protein]-cysteine S-methyltransferase [Luteococcus sp. H138]|uniref:methylated-DNA--[protein]-cysteine S-methyltransferase n=1 Tax=unclassified Luteococcus TaxID=2639923 RepID=UPI00313F18B0
MNSSAIRRADVDSPLGPLTLVAEGGNLIGVFFANHRVQPERAAEGEPVALADEDVLARAAGQLAEYFAGQRTSFDLPLVPHAHNELDPRVWEQLSQIPYGQTVTYGQIARGLGDVNLAQPVGGSVGRNPLGIIVPCHRVMGANGKLTGFAGGEDRKAWLLGHEAFVSGQSLVPPQPL